MHIEHRSVLLVTAEAGFYAVIQQVVHILSLRDAGAKNSGHVGCED